MKWYVWLVLVLTLLATIVHYTIEPKGQPIVQTAHAETKPLSDFEQERQYCAEVLAGVKFEGGTIEQVRTHCQKYLK